LKNVKKDFGLEELIGKGKDDQPEWGKKGKAEEPPAPEPVVEAAPAPPPKPAKTVKAK